MNSTANSAAIGHEPKAQMAAHALEDALGPLVHTMGYELVMVELAGGVGRSGRVVRAYLDRAPDGVTVDDCAKMSRIIGNALEAEVEPTSPEIAKLLAGGYTLEVSSPGIDRPLARRSHFDRSVGQRVKIRTFEPLEEGSRQRTFHGVVSGTRPDASYPDDDRRGVVVVRDPDAAPDSADQTIPLPSIRKANLVADIL